VFFFFFVFFVFVFFFGLTPPVRDLPGPRLCTGLNAPNRPLRSVAEPTVARRIRPEPGAPAPPGGQGCAFGRRPPSPCSIRPAHAFLVLGLSAPPSGLSQPNGAGRVPGPYPFKPPLPSQLQKLTKPTRGLSIPRRPTPIPSLNPARQPVRSGCFGPRLHRQGMRSRRARANVRLGRRVFPPFFPRRNTSRTVGFRPSSPSRFSSGGGARPADL